MGESVYDRPAARQAWQDRYDRICSTWQAPAKLMTTMAPTQPPLRALPRTTALLQQAVRDRTFPGCVYAVYAAGAVQAHQAIGYFRYIGDAASAAPPDPTPDHQKVQLDTRYDAASLTKVMAATAAAMLLYDRGALALDQPVSELLPGFAAEQAADPRRAAVTVRMLLDHSSGLPGYVRLFESASDRRSILELCMRQPLTAAPGTRAEYSDIGFMLLGAILEQLAGEPLDGFCQREIFAPLAMTATGFCPPLPLRAQIPPTEMDDAFRHLEVQGEVHDENAWVMGGVSGHAGLFTDALDVMRFAGCILHGGRGPDGQRLFASSTVKLFATRTGHPGDSSRALGWDTPSVPSSSGTRFSAHSVGHLGFTGTSLWIDLDAGVAVTLLTNRTWPHRDNQAIRLLRPLFHDAVRSELSL